MDTDRSTVSIYKELSMHEHVLLRPDTYVGSVERHASPFVYVATQEANAPETLRMQLSPPSFSSAFERIFIEVLANGIDNFLRSKGTPTPCKHLTIDFCQDSGSFTLANGGCVLPIEKNDKGVYIPEMVFGRLLTSSNYNDAVERETSGRNGIGVKSCNILSSQFQITIRDAELGKEYTQSWSSNMTIRNEPKIKSKKVKRNEVVVSWTPDYERLCTDRTSTMIAGMARKHALDAALALGTDVHVSFCGKRVVVKDLAAYASLYHPGPGLTILKHGSVTAVVKNAEEAPHSVSFVNGICTPEGGLHMDECWDKIGKALVKMLGKKGLTVTVKDLRGKLDLFVQCTLPNPTFNNQSKEKLTGPKPKWGDVIVEESCLKKMQTWEFVQALREQEDRKKAKKDRATDSKKRAQRVEGLDSANLAGGKKSAECTLILCEGLSAKTFAVTGIQYGWNGRSGRDYFGIYPLRGKLLNVRNAVNHHTNKELTDLKTALNLRQGIDYTQPEYFKELNYGRVMIMTDADVDGLHIEGLITNWFDVVFPSLLRIPFLYTMKTPIVKISMPNKTLTSFYDERMYIDFAGPDGAKLARGAKVKYYKGLGTSTRQDIQETFGKKVLRYVQDDRAKDSLALAFDAKRAGDRKGWIDGYLQNPSYVKTKSVFENQAAHSQTMDISTFVDEMLVQFSIDDVQRSIPSMIDGFKISHRKILYAMRLRNTADPIKVAQWAGYVAEKTHYRHGEQCLLDTIVKMAQNFIGANNIPLLTRDGQFGSRLCGGKDAASGRYIFTRLEKIQGSVFPSSDDPLLTYRSEENTRIEPVCYYPVIPFVLINGCNAGIGTGWSTFVPNYRPQHVIRAVRDWIADRDMTPLVPWYRGFTGTIRADGPASFVTEGKMEDRGSEVHITELPIGVWTDKCKTMLDQMENAKKIKKYTSHCTTDAVHFILKKNDQADAFTMEQLGLVSMLKTSNMTFLDEHDRICTFPTAEALVRAFCTKRLAVYEKRRLHEIAICKDTLALLEGDRVFIRLVLGGQIRLLHVETDIATQPTVPKVNGSYDRYLAMPVRSFSEKRVEGLDGQIRKLRADKAALEASTAKTLWGADLDALEAEVIKTGLDAVGGN